MKVYKTQDIRNVAILGHGGCGKTSLVEAMAHVTGVTNRQGRVEDGNTISDYDKEEIRRKFSISTSVVPIEWNFWKINLLDTPGYLDFAGEVDEALAAADGAIIVINGKAGVEAGTEKAWDYCEKYGIPRAFFVTNMDDENADYVKVIEQLRELYGKRIAPFHLPIREDGKFTGGGKWVERDIPADVQDDLDATREALMEAVAETNEEYMDRYFEGDEFTVDEIIDALRLNVNEGNVVPVQCGSGTMEYGIEGLIQTCVEFLPSPMRDNIKIFGKDPRTDKEYNVDYDSRRPFSAYVFKTIVDPFIGRYSLIKVCSGSLRSDSVIYNYEKDTEEKLSRIYILRGKEAIEMPELKAGDIGAIAKLSNTATGDTLSLKADPLVFEKFESQSPYTYMRYEAVNKGDEDKVSQALQKMMEEDLTLKTYADTENRQSLIYGMGDQHLDVITHWRW